MENYYSYSPCGEAFVIEGRAGELLIGDQLPSTESEAKLLCRCANRAHQTAIALVKQQAIETIGKIGDDRAPT